VAIKNRGFPHFCFCLFVFFVFVFVLTHQGVPSIIIIIIIIIISERTIFNNHKIHNGSYSSSGSQMAHKLVLGAPQILRLGQRCLKWHSGHFCSILTWFLL